MKVIVIYDSRRPEKEPLFKEQLKWQNIDYEIYYVEVNPKKQPVENISESFKSVIIEAKLHNEKEICIIEDDIFFTHTDSWSFFLENKPTSFDVYIGGTYLLDKDWDYSKSLIKVPEWVGNHCIIINERYYDIWLSSDSSQHCDNAQKEQGEFYVCNPFIALQRAGLWSANNRAPQNYNSKLPVKLIFNGQRIYNLS